MAIVYTDDIHYKNIAKSIRAKNGETKTYLPSEMPNAIDEIFTGIDTSDATSIESDILVGKTAYVNDVKITGTMVNNGAIQENINADESYTIPAGYHNGSGVVKATSLSVQTEATATETDIKSGQTAWVNGKKIFGTHVCEGLEDMTADATATATDLLLNTTAYVDGSKITGTMPNNGAVSQTLLAGENYIVPKGYHDGNGTVSASTLEEQTNATATEADILYGKTAYVNGSKVTGLIPSISIDAPDIAVSPEGLITVSVNYGRGYVFGGEESSTKQLMAQTGETIIPGTTDQTAASAGMYVIGDIVVKGDANLQPSNIKSGVSIFGVQGSLTAEGGGISLPALTNQGMASDLIYGKQLIDSNGNIVTGTLSNAEEAKFGV